MCHSPQQECQVLPGLIVVRPVCVCLSEAACLYVCVCVSVGAAGPATVLESQCKGARFYQDKVSRQCMFLFVCGYVCLSVCVCVLVCLSV